MGLEPDFTMPEIQKQQPQTSRTYKLDLESKRIIGKVDGLKAIEQFVLKVISTARFRYLIYSSQYGNEALDLKGQDITQEYIEAELPRMVTEAIIYDERVLKVDGFVFDFIGDEVFVSFEVDTTEGYLKVEGVKYGV